jgi:hypothetical protein
MSLAMEFSGAVPPGAVTVDLEILHEGRSTTSVLVTLLRDRRRVSGLAKVGVSGAGHGTGARPDVSVLPGPESTPVFVAPYGDLPYTQYLELRLLDQRVDLADLRHGLRSLLWVRLMESADEVEALSHAGRAAVLLDGLPPGLFFVEDPATFTPTIDFALHIAPGVPRPDDGWYLAETVTNWTSSDFCMEDLRLWTSSGEPVAWGRQNRRVLKALPT